MSGVFRLADGSYDVVVVDASRDGNDLAIEITILAGEHKGEVVAIRTSDLDSDEFELLGLPGTLSIENGVPHFALEK